MARVLVVDDEPDLRELLRVNLAMEGHEVAVAPDGERGLQLIREQRPELVILDVMMPGMDGWSVLQALKADPDPGLAHIPVLMLTARAEDIDRIRGGIEGAVRYLTKPFPVRQLRQAVRDALDGAPEPEQRRAAQHDALVRLARLESGQGEVDPERARPRLTRLEPAGRPPSAAVKAPRWPAWLDNPALTERDREIVAAVLSTAGLNEARVHLDVSRSYLYASLRRIAGKLGMASGPALARALQVARASHDRAREP
jgi:DNA-binding response OmpR family regulator